MLRDEAQDATGAALRAALVGQDPLIALHPIREDASAYVIGTWLASCIWHEKRHFFDCFMTNYGARRFRDILSLASNLPYLANDARKTGQPLWLPIEIYGNSTRRKVLGIPEPSPRQRELARLAVGLKEFTAHMDAPITNGVTTLQIGAEAQMEGLAQASQFATAERYWGPQVSELMYARYVAPMPRTNAYRSIETVALRQGCVRFEEGVVKLDSGLAAALFTTALCGPFYGRGSTPQYDITYPWPRFAQLAEELGSRRGYYRMPDEEAWALVDAAARRIWGRTALDELDADTDGLEQRREQLAHFGADSLAGALDAFISLRRTMLKIARVGGSLLLSPNAFADFWVDRLQPWHVVATPRGVTIDKDDPASFIGIEIPVPEAWRGHLPKDVSWGSVHEPEAGDEVYAIHNQKAWTEMLTLHAPSALLLLNGRRHRRMIPPELERVITTIRQGGIDVRFDPRFEWPEQREAAERHADALALSALSGGETLTCDRTGRPVPPAKALVLTPWEFRRSKLRDGFVEDTGVAGLHALEADWTDWVIHEDVLAP